MWNNIKKALKATPFVGAALYDAKHYFNYYITQEFGGLNEGELLVFEAIKRDVRNVFDVGARFNTDYADRATGLSIELHLFEPNPIFFRKLQKRLGTRAGLHLHNFGLSDRPGELIYYKDTQSFIKSHHVMESRLPGERLQIKTLSGFCSATGVEYIDFLKVDVEALDFHVLLGGRDIIQATCKFCQVEVGIDARLDSEKVAAHHYYAFFEDRFDLYLLRDAQHPICKEFPRMPVLASLTTDLRDRMERYLDVGYGPNLLAVRKGIALPQALGKLMKGQ